MIYYVDQSELDNTSELLSTFETLGSRYNDPDTKIIYRRTVYECGRESTPRPTFVNPFGYTRDKTAVSPIGKSSAQGDRSVHQQIELDLVSSEIPTRVKNKDVKY